MNYICMKYAYINPTVNKTVELSTDSLVVFTPSLYLFFEAGRRLSLPVWHKDRVATRYVPCFPSKQTSSLRFPLHCKAFHRLLTKFLFISSSPPSVLWFSTRSDGRCELSGRVQVSMKSHLCRVVVVVIIFPFFPPSILLSLAHLCLPLTPNPFPLPLWLQISPCFLCLWLSHPKQQYSIRSVKSKL